MKVDCSGGGARMSEATYEFAAQSGDFPEWRVEDSRRSQTTRPSGAAGRSPAAGFRLCLANSAELYISIKFFGRIVLDKPVTPMNLHAFVGTPHRHFAGIEFGHG